MYACLYYCYSNQCMLTTHGVRSVTVHVQQRESKTQLMAAFLVSSPEAFDFPSLTAGQNGYRDFNISGKLLDLIQKVKKVK